ncbi:MAG TPA: FGGY family carbohydrate kinase [Chthoniobacterales bacterium]
MPKDLFLAIDVGTGSVRAALTDLAGQIVAFHSAEHDQQVPHFGWSQQRPSDWWKGAVHCIRAVLGKIDNAAARIVSVACCGQMHGTVLLDQNGVPVVDYAPLWNDKRTRDVLDEFLKRHDQEKLLPVTGNPAATAWPAFKLLWFQKEHPEVFDRAVSVLIVKDFINFRLTGCQAIDHPEASTTYLYDIEKRSWSASLAGLLGLNPKILPEIKRPTDLVGAITQAASEETGLLAGTTVAVGAGDFPVTLLGSGVSPVGVGSDSTGTSTLLTLQTERAVLHPIISNVLGIDEGWSAFTILDAGGDAVRWARRAFHDNQVSYEELVQVAASAPPGSDGLVFLPYLNGERLGSRRNARAQFFGLTYAHDSGHLHRAVMEGVAFASRRSLSIMEQSENPMKYLVASGGGAKTRLWLEIKASIYRTSIRTTKHTESSILGCTMIAGVAAGIYGSLAEAAKALIHLDEEIAPNPDWVPRYEKLARLFDELYENAGPYYQELDVYAAQFGGEGDRS